MSYYFSKYFIRDIYFDIKGFFIECFCTHDWVDISTEDWMYMRDPDKYETWRMCVKCGKESEYTEHRREAKQNSKEES